MTHCYELAVTAKKSHGGNSSASVSRLGGTAISYLTADVNRLMQADL